MSVKDIHEQAWYTSRVLWKKTCDVGALLVPMPALGTASADNPKQSIRLASQLICTLARSRHDTVCFRFPVSARLWFWTVSHGISADECLLLDDGVDMVTTVLEKVQPSRIHTVVPFSLSCCISRALVTFKQLDADIPFRRWSETCSVRSRHHPASSTTNSGNVTASSSGDSARALHKWTAYFAFASDDSTRVEPV